MNIVSRRLLFGALFFILLLGGCNLPAASPAPIGTVISTAQITNSPAPTNSAAPTVLIPITGVDVVSLQCQFCVNDQAHAVLIMSDQATFSVADPNSGITCATAQEVNGKRILLCRGLQQSTFTLNICVDATNCLQFPVTLQLCPLIPETGAGTVVPFVTFTPVTPFYLTPINTLIPPTQKPKPTNTGVVPTSPVSTLTPPPILTTEPPPSTPVPTEVTPQATEPPPATTEPSTSAPTTEGNGGKKTTKTPRK
jgi:hypothetical protein